MEGFRYPEHLFDYIIYRKTKTGWPLKRPPDGYSCEAETGHLLAELRDQKNKKKKIHFVGSGFTLYGFVSNI
jgi:hypothetical protein